jgi:hypothetical protein
MNSKTFFRSFLFDWSCNYNKFLWCPPFPQYYEFIFFLLVLLRCWRYWNFESGDSLLWSFSDYVLESLYSWKLGMNCFCWFSLI